MTKQERIQSLRKAQELIVEAIDNIEYAMEDTEMESSVQSYIIAHLENWMQGNNPYDDTTIPRLIEFIIKMERERK